MITALQLMVGFALGWLCKSLLSRLHWHEWDRWHLTSDKDGQVSICKTCGKLKVTWL